jgi:hypothetical protein
MKKTDCLDMIIVDSAQIWFCEFSDQISAHIPALSFVAEFGMDDCFHFRTETNHTTLTKVPKILNFHDRFMSIFGLRMYF